jgi:hypothetical protein
MINFKALFFASAALFLSGGLTSCAKDEVTPVRLEFGRKYNAAIPLWDLDATSNTYLVGNVKKIGYTDLTGLIESRKQSFVLLIADVNTTCLCFSYLRESLIAYLKVSNAFVYAINPTEFNGGVKNYDLKVSSAEGYETVAIFEKGALKYQRQRNGQDDAWSKDSATFISWMEARVSVSSMLYIDLKQLEAAVNGTASLNGLDQFTIGFFRDRCTDCRYLSDNFLLTYNAGTHGESYVIDCDVPGMHDPKDGTTDPTTESKAAWTAFKDKYGLSTTMNTTLGYGSGYVPCFQNRQNGEIRDMEVYVNDDISLNADQSTCSISDTYWDGSRSHEFFDSAKTDVVKDFKQVAALKAISKDDYSTIVYEGQTYYSWNHDKAAIYHDPLLQSFLDYYVAK